MSISSISSYAAYLDRVRTLTGGQREISELQTQLATLTKSKDLSFYGTQGREIMDLRTEFVRRTGYSNAIDHVNPRIKAYDMVMDRFDKLISDMNSATRLPPGPGTARLTNVQNPTNDTLKVKVVETQSHFTANATYTISAVPSSSGPPGSFDVTVVDGLGGKATNTVNLRQIPPQVDADRFILSGGPGDGAVVKLEFEQLTGPGTSSFKVDFPELTATRVLIDGALQEVQAMLNERIGDRYLFSGSRYATKPVEDLTAEKQVTRITLVGSPGDAEEVYELVLEGRRFTYTTTGAETSLDEVLTNSSGTGLIDQVRAHTPPFNVTASVLNGMATFTANTLGEPFSLSTQVYDNPTYLNRIEPPAAAVVEPYTVVVASDTTRQMDQFVLHGNEWDVGDTFSVELAQRSIVQNENAPPQVIRSGPFKYDLVVNPADVALLSDAVDNGTVDNGFPAFPTPHASKVGNAAPAPNAGTAYTTPTGMADWMAQKMAALINADGSIPVVASVVNGELTLTALETDTEFETVASVNNAGNTPRMITNTLPPLAGQDPFSVVQDDPRLPFYDSQYKQMLNNPAAWDIEKVSGDDNLRVSYGVTSVDPAFQKLIYGLRQARTAVENPGRYSELMQEARNMLIDAQTSLRSVQARVVNAEALLNGAQERHKDTMNTLTTRLAAIEGIDENEVAARLQAALNLQQANYTVTGRVAQLSLVNFLT